MSFGKRVPVSTWHMAGAADQFARDSGVSAGPAGRFPLGPKREPWQGQSRVDSAWFQRTRQPMCVQTAELFLSIER